MIGDGILVIDKPSGITSFEVIRKVKKLTKDEKIGHTGTLDPLATGVLPLCFNRATKLVPLLMEGDKEYEVTMQLGVETDTQDATGRIIRKNRPQEVNQETLVAVLKTFEGRIKQLPPMFSALKYKGKPLYKLARRGIEIKREKREIEIKSIQLTEINFPYCSFKVSCSKGTYIRTLCADIGKKLTCGAHLVQLRRTRTGPFTLLNAISLEETLERFKKGTIREKMISLAEALPDFLPLIFHQELLEKVKKRLKIVPTDLKSIFLPNLRRGEKVKILSPQGELYAIAEMLTDIPITSYHEEDVFKLKRIFVN